MGDDDGAHRIISRNTFLQLRGNNCKQSPMGGATGDQLKPAAAQNGNVFSADWLTFGFDFRQGMSL